MFKNASFSDEIYRSMEKILVDNQVENQYGFKRLGQAVDLLNKSAETFEQAGMTDISDDIIKFLNNFSGTLK